MSLLHASFDEFFPLPYLKTFYEGVVASAIRVTMNPKDLERIWKSEKLKEPLALKEAVMVGGTLEAVLRKHPEGEAKIYQSLHYLVLMHAISFNDVGREKTLSAILERYTKFYTELHGKTADEVFAYFGATANSSVKVIQTIFDDYSGSNHPKTLGKDATPEIRDLCKKCFDIMSEARDVLTNETSRTALLAGLRAKAVERQQHSQNKMNEGLDLLRKGKAREAFDSLKEAEKLFATPLIGFISAWAEIKAEPSISRERLLELASKIDNFTADERRSAFYGMAAGLIKKELGDSAGAVTMFEKALQADSQFLEVRRELNALKLGSGKRGETKKIDILTGDISEVVGQIFRRKPN